MKNIHILPTDKPSNLVFEKLSNRFYTNSRRKSNTNNLQNQNIYITSDEKPKAGDWSLYHNKIHKCIEDIVGDDFKKIILTTDQDLIKDGVQAINDEFLEWFVKNPSCEKVEVDSFVKYNPIVYQIILPKPKQETLEEAALNYSKQFLSAEDSLPQCDFKKGAELQADRMYSEEEVLELLHKRMIHNLGDDYQETTTTKWFEQFKKE